MNVREMVALWLGRCSMDGLYAEDECACKLDDLAPCGEMQESCRAGYLAPCGEDCGDHDWHIQEEKPK